MTDTKPLTVKEAAPMLRLSEASVYALCSSKRLRHQRVGVGRGKILIPPDALDEYLAKGTVRSTEGHPTDLLFKAARK
ncbi:helix-turn-helix domain-containing protein [Isosphaeraceae bacterium EP7]